MASGNARNTRLMPANAVSVIHESAFIRQLRHGLCVFIHVPGRVAMITLERETLTFSNPRGEYPSSFQLFPQPGTEEGIGCASVNPPRGNKICIVGRILILKATL